MKLLPLVSQYIRANGAKKRVPPKLSIGDFWGGLAAMLVALPSSIAFGVLTYSALGTEYSGMGAMAGILGAAALGLITPFIGKTGGLISAPCAPSAAVLSGLVAGLASGRLGTALTPGAILPLIAITAFISALLQILYGTAGGGRLIKFIPFPVVSGYLSGVAVLIALGQIPKLFGLPHNVSVFEGLLTPSLWRLEGLAVGIVTIVSMALASRITQKIPAAIIGLMGGILTYFGLSYFSPGLLSLENNPLVIGSIQASGSILDAVSTHLSSLFSFDLSSLSLIIIPALTLSVLLSIDTLKTCVGLDAMTHHRHNSDRELIGQGVGNLASALIGGMPGAGTMGPTLVNIVSGGKMPISGVVSGAFIVLAFLLLGRLIAWVPIGALAGILLVIAWRMFDRRMFRLLRTQAGRLDFTVIAGVVFVSITVDLIAAAGTGVALSILLFVRDQIRGSVIRSKLYLDQTSSKTIRGPEERALLMRKGKLGVFCALQGNLFFGTTDHLFSQLEHDLRKARYVLLDMRRVQSMDYTAAHLFEQMHNRLAERGGQLLFSGMPSGLLNRRDFQLYLAQLGVVYEGGGVMIAETLDGALEWIEDRILEEAGRTSEQDKHLLDATEFELFREFGSKALDRVKESLIELTVPEGKKVFAQGELGDEIYLVRRGSVRIMLPLPHGKHHHLATVDKGGIFGEVAFLDRGKRTAEAIAKEQTDLYALSRARLNKLSRSDPKLGAQIFARLALALAFRLRQTDVELRILEER
ncbi:MAG: SLC26A/SulP transporter family protein [Bacteroidota bacterium]